MPACPQQRKIPSIIRAFSSVSRRRVCCIALWRQRRNTRSFFLTRLSHPRKKLRSFPPIITNTTNAPLQHNYYYEKLVRDAGYADEPSRGLPTLLFLLYLSCGGRSNRSGFENPTGHSISQVRGVVEISLHVHYFHVSTFPRLSVVRAMAIFWPLLREKEINQSDEGSLWCIIWNDRRILVGYECLYDLLEINRARAPIESPPLDPRPVNACVFACIFFGIV